MKKEKIELTDKQIKTKKRNYLYRQTQGYRDSLKKHRESDLYKKTTAAFKKTQSYKDIIVRHRKTEKFKVTRAHYLLGLM